MLTYVHLCTLYYTTDSQYLQKDFYIYQNYTRNRFFLGCASERMKENV